MNQNVKTSLGTIIIIIFAAITGFVVWRAQDNGEESAKTVRSIYSGNHISKSEKGDGNVSNNISKDDAIDLVAKLPEVKKYTSQVEKNNRTVGFMVNDNSPLSNENTNNFWEVQVYENFTDRAMTFNYYDVNKKTGEIKKVLR